MSPFDPDDEAPTRGRRPTIDRLLAIGLGLLSAATVVLVAVMAGRWLPRMTTRARRKPARCPVNEGRVPDRHVNPRRARPQRRDTKAVLQACKTRADHGVHRRVQSTGRSYPIAAPGHPKTMEGYLAGAFGPRLFLVLARSVHSHTVAKAPLPRQVGIARVVAKVTAGGDLRLTGIFGGVVWQSRVDAKWTTRRKATAG